MTSLLGGGFRVRVYTGCTTGFPAPPQNLSEVLLLDMRILLVDDEVELTEPLGRLLTREGYDVEVATDGALGSQLVGQHHYDLLILDWMLPYRSGLEICQQLRAGGNMTPVLFLTAKDTLDDRVQGLDSGADDYLVKPFELRELLARVRALLRRSLAPEPTGSAALLCVGDLELDCQNQFVHRQGRVITLSEKETQLLAYFMTHPGHLLTHGQIQQQLWGNEHQPSSNALAAQIRLLRRKIEIKGDPPLIHTIYGKGYRLSLLTGEGVG